MQFYLLTTRHSSTQRHHQNFPDWVDNEIHAYLCYCLQFLQIGPTQQRITLNAHISQHLLGSSAELMAAKL